MRIRRNERGVVAVEMAFVMPLLVLFLIGSLQVGLVIVGRSTVTSAAREGARAASIRYECADNHTSTRCPANPSTNYTFIKTAVESKLAGLVKPGSVTVTVRCRDGNATGPVVTCERGFVDADTDVVEVQVQWKHIGATPYVADMVHSNTARSVIIGRPDLSVLSPEPDTTAPTVLSAHVYDTDINGVLDQIKLTFSEDIAQSVSASRFAITNSVTGSSTISSATVSNRVVTITLSGGATVNTAPGSMRISLSAGSDGVRDLWGNQASFTNQALTDAAKPVLVGLSDTAGLTSGYPNALDTLTLSFSEPIATPLSTTNITYTDPAGGGNSIDTISLSSISSGPMTTASNSYASADSTITVSGLVSKSGNNVTVTVLAPLACSTLLCLGLGAGSDSAPWTFTPTNSLADAAGNTATGTRTISNLF